jgi:hypothetical protein
MATAERKPIQTVEVQPAIDRDISSARPTETRYGWCPYAPINLVGPSGTPALYVQPHKIDSGSGNMDNPYHRVLPKNQLIAFPTFAAVENVLSPDLVDSNGRAVSVQGTRTITALEAATMVLRNYSFWGFVILNSLQGKEQSEAMRIFKVVQPFDYNLGELENELTFGALERIEATEPLVFGDYTVQPLADDAEREVARRLAGELADGASIAYTLATSVLNETESSMTQRFAGGNGKVGPDANDIRLAKELGRELPKLIGKKDELGEIKEQMGFLVSREASRADRERIAELEAKIASMENGTAPVAVPPASEEAKYPPIRMADPVTVNGRKGKIVKPFFGKFEIEFEDGSVEKVHRSEITQ